MIDNAIKMQNLYDSLLASVEEPIPSSPHPAFYMIPNPSQGKIMIRFFLPSNSPAKIELLDLCGRSVQMNFFGHLAQGMNEINLDMSSLPSGTYFLTVSSEYFNIIKTIKFIR